MAHFGTEMNTLSLACQMAGKAPFSFLKNEKALYTGEDILNVLLWRAFNHRWSPISIKMGKTSRDPNILGLVEVGAGMVTLWVNPAFPEGGFLLWAADAAWEFCESRRNTNHGGGGAELPAPRGDGFAALAERASKRN